MMTSSRVLPAFMTVALACVPMCARAQQGQPAGQAGQAVPQEKELRTFLNAHPDNLQAHLKLGQIYLDQTRYADAADEFGAAKKLAPKKEDIDAQFAWALYLAGKTDALLVQIKPGDRAPDAESRVRLSLGLAQLNPLEIDKAEPLLRDAVQLDPKSWEARLAYAHFLLLKRRLPEAREQVEAAQALAPTEVGVIRMRAGLKRLEGDVQGAIADYTQVIDKHPTSLPALAGRADALISLGKLTDAEADVVAAHRLNPNSQLVFLEALITAQQGKIREAGDLLQRVSSRFPVMPIAGYLYGVVNFWQGEPETAYNQMIRFHAAVPNAQGATLLLAEISLRRKDPTNAIQLLQPLVEENPANAEAVTKLARAYLVNGQADRALEMYQHVVAAPPPQKPVPDVDPVTLMMMYGDATGDLLEVEKVIMKTAPDAAKPAMALRMGDIDGAAKLAEAAAEQNIDNPMVQTVLGYVRLAQKRYADAAEIFNKVIVKNPDYTPASFGLVEVLVSAGRLDEAKGRLWDLAPGAAGG